jgi:hypothetical protein
MLTSESRNWTSCAHFTGDLKGEAAMEPDATLLPLLARGACATRGIFKLSKGQGERSCAGQTHDNKASSNIKNKIAWKSKRCVVDDMLKLRCCETRRK